MHLNTQVQLKLAEFAEDMEKSQEKISEGSFPGRPTCD